MKFLHSTTVLIKRTGTELELPGRSRPLQMEVCDFPLSIARNHIFRSDRGAEVLKPSRREEPIFENSATSRSRTRPFKRRTRTS